MYQTLMTKNLRKYVICEDRLNFRLNVDTDETWRMNMRVFGDITVKTGSKLTVTCELHMSPNARITVERGAQLIIDGGLLTGDCDDMWKGIVVEGDVPGKQAQSGKVLLMNGATIEHAKDAISMNPDHRPWDNGNLQNYFGGIVDASNATIRKCRRGVEFMKYARAGTKDKSKFDNVVFENILKQGVTTWANDGVTFNNCTFRQIEQSGVLAYDCEVLVQTNNTFEQTPIGVDALTTYPIIFSPKIGEDNKPGNMFLCQSAGVNVQSGGNIERIIVVNNVFSGGNNGVRLNGNSSFTIKKNNLSGHLTAIQLYESGPNFNLVSGNQVQSSYLGSHAIKPNPGVRYHDNCFSANQLVDIFVSDGSIFSWQGSPALAAGNCFNKKRKTRNRQRCRHRPDFLLH
jgi:Nitrous oxidase accessory protein